jgi:hypothetical protein
MEYVVCILIVPWLVYTKYEEWKDAHKTRRQQANGALVRNIWQNKEFSSFRSGRLLLILGFAAIGP